MFMKKDNELEKAKELAKLFLHMPVDTTEYSPMFITHPFWESAFVSDGDGVFNLLEDKERYQKYQEYFSRKCLDTCVTLIQLVYRFRKSFRLTFVDYLYKEHIISKITAGNLIADIWTTIEVVNHDVNVPKNRVLSYIQKADKEIIMDENEKKVVNELPEVVTVYRGCESRAGLNGLCFTLNKNTAFWFATRYQEKGFVMEATIGKNDIIAYKDSRGENEIILDYRKLLSKKIEPAVRIVERKIEPLSC